MQAMKIFVENLRIYMESQEIKTYCELSKALSINLNTLKGWLSCRKNISLQSLDVLANNLNVPTYILMQKNAKFDEYQNNANNFINNSSITLANNLKIIFIDKSKVSWSERETLFYGQIGEKALMSYVRKNSPRIPPISKIDLMAECLGVEVYMMIKEDAFDEKINSSRT